MDSLCGEPVCLWLPETCKKLNPFSYVQRVEVAADDHGKLPGGFDTITLPAAEYLMFQRELFQEEDYCGATAAVRQAMSRYDPSVIGYTWDHTNPRVQLKPRSARGYIELRPVKF